MSNNFVSWVSKEIESRGWSDSEFARRIGIHPSTVSRILNRERNLTWDFCAGVARVFGMPADDIFRRAELLPPLPLEVAEEKEAVRILRSMSAQQRAYVLTTMRAIAGHESTTQRLDPYQELLNIIWDMTPDELKERIVIRLQETVEEHEQEKVKHKAQGKAEELTEKDDN